MSLITNILTGVWEVSPAYAQGFLPIAKRIANGENLTFGQIRQHVKEREVKYEAFKCAVPAETGSYGYGFSSAADDRIGIVKISGLMIKESDASTYGTDEAYQLLKEAGENPGIIATVIEMNSGGGYSDAAFNIFDLTKTYFETYGKPIYSLVDGMAASAGYKAIVGTEKIILNGKTSMVGSIGTYGTIIDPTGAYEKEGYRIIEVYADESKDKNLDYREALEGNTDLYRETVNKFQKSFKQTVKIGRGDKLGSENVFTGKEYYGVEGVMAGLADDIMTKAEAYDYFFRQGMKRKKKKY